MEETWVEVEGYPNYAVSNLGRVLNIQRDQILRFRPAVDGGLRVALSQDGQAQDFYVHHLVFDAFYGGYHAGEQIIHYNGDKTDNTPENLRARKRVRRLRRDVYPIQGEVVGPGRRWGRRIRIVETGEIFRTVRDCADHIRGDYASIYACLRGERRTHRNFTFEYYDWESSNAA